MVQPLLIRVEETHLERQTPPRVAQCALDHGPQQPAVLEVFLTREARLAGQIMAEGGTELLPGATAFLLTLFGMTL